MVRKNVVEFVYECENKIKDKILKDKQYLKTNVPSYKRCSEYLKSNATKETVVEGDWIDADLENKPKCTHDYLRMLFCFHGCFFVAILMLLQRIFYRK